MRWFACLVLCACYSPGRDLPCTISCAETRDCPGGLACIESLCRTAEGGCGAGDDAAVDADASPTEVCAGDASGLLPHTCFDPPPQVRTLGGAFDTSLAVNCDRIITTASPELCVIAVDTIATDVAFTGSRAPVLWSPTTLTVMARIDAASRNFALPVIGPATAEVCPPTPPSTNGGGAGGSFGTAGGNGGPTGAPGGMPVPVVGSLGQIRGGCAGGAGGSTGGGGGRPGGAVYLMAHDSIVVASVIDASGAGGFNGAIGRGGGGGGSGGLIGLDAPSIVLQSSAAVFAVGGGGAPGGGVTMTGNSMASEAICCPFVVPAATAGTDDGGDGGAAGTNMDGRTGGQGLGSAGGGGGGGGAGFIKVFPVGALQNSALVLLPDPTS